MDFYEVLDQVVALLQTRRRVTYGALQLQFKLDDEHLQVLNYIVMLTIWTALCAWNIFRRTKRLWNHEA